MRAMIRLAALITLVAWPLAAAQPASDAVGLPLSAWRLGTLDIHQIVTGRGNAAFVQMPDGTTLLVDAGAAGGGIPHTHPRPDGTRRPGQWIAAYIDRVWPPGAPRRLDFAVMTHFHVDHIGGLSDVAAQFPIGTLIDRGWPAYDYPEPVPAALVDGYRAFIAAARKTGTTVERAQVGTANQIVGRSPVRLTPDEARPRPDMTVFEARIVAANGEVWTGAGTATVRRFPPQSAATRADERPSENECSVALRLSLGAFDFYTGGDLTGIPDPGQAPWRDLETPIAAAMGSTDVRVMNHHGSISPDNAAFLAATRSRVVIIPAWSPTHPAPDALKRALAPTAYAGPRDVFVTILREPTALTIGDRVTQLKSTHGHIVVRVAADGASYRVVVLDDESDQPRVMAVHGPYASR